MGPSETGGSGMTERIGRLRPIIPVYTECQRIQRNKIGERSDKVIRKVCNKVATQDVEVVKAIRTHFPSDYRGIIVEVGAGILKPFLIPILLGVRDGKLCRLSLIQY